MGEEAAKIKTSAANLMGKAGEKVGAFMDSVGDFVEDALPSTMGGTTPSSNSTGYTQ
jgi:hypothetical protein